MTTIDDTESGDQGEFRGKEFDEVWPLIKDANAKVHVWKAPDGMTDSKKWGACFTFKPGEFDQSEVIDVLQAEYGPGDYPLQIKTKAKNNAPKIVWQRTLHITPRKFKPTAEREPPATATTATDGLALALASIAEGQRAILEALKSQPTPPAAPSTLDVAKDLAAYKELFSDNRPAPIEMFREMMELKSLLMDENGDAGNPMTAAIRMVEKLADVAKEAQENERTRPPLRKRSAPGPTPAPDSPTPAATNQAPAPAATADSVSADVDTEDIEPTALEVDAAFEFFAKTYLPAAMHLYTSHQQPPQVAEWLVRHVTSTPGTPVALINIGLVISDDQMVQRLAGFNPGVMDAAAWFDAVADSLAFALWPDDNPEPAPFDATKNATTDKNTDDDRIIDVDPKAEPEQEPPDHAKTPVDDQDHDAASIDPPGTGDDHDA